MHAHMRVLIGTFRDARSINPEGVCPLLALPGDRHSDAGTDRHSDAGTERHSDAGTDRHGLRRRHR